MKIVVDARFYGLENAGLGRYTINLLNELQTIDKQNKYFILLRKIYFENLKLSNNFEKVLVDIPHYSLKEQIELPKIIAKINPDLTHFLHFNIPIIFNGKFIVTIHDMIMHTQKIQSTNLALPLYFLKHALYKRVFRHAATAAQKIIVPSEFVKGQLIHFFEIDEKKIKVIYEG